MIPNNYQNFTRIPKFVPQQPRKRSALLISYPYRKNSHKEKYLKYIFNVPSVVKTELEFRHENIEAWYRGVILLQMLQFSILADQSISNIFNKSRFTDSRLDASEFTSLHIRRPEKKHTKKFFGFTGNCFSQRGKCRPWLNSRVFYGFFLLNSCKPLANSCFKPTHNPL